MMQAIDITAFNFQQLDELRKSVENRVTEMRETGAPTLREQSAQQASAIGMTIEEIVEGGKGRRGRARGRNGDSE